MTFDDILDQASALLQRRGRVTYRTLKRQFQLDDEALEDLKEELLYSYPEVVDDEGRGLIWTATPASASSPSPPAPLPASAPARQPQEPPISYTPRYLTEKILTSRSALEEAELHRLKGELLLQQSSGNQPEAETCFQKALDVARSQQAKSWELRAATSLARLWQPQDKRQEAYDLLAPVYNWFTEGFDTADLKEAKALLDNLAEDMS